MKAFDKHILKVREIHFNIETNSFQNSKKLSHSGNVSYTISSTPHSHYLFQPIRFAQIYLSIRNISAYQMFVNVFFCKRDVCQFLFLLMGIFQISFLYMTIQSFCLPNSFSTTGIFAIFLFLLMKIFQISFLFMII